MKWLLPLLLATGCAVLPRGPIVTHSVERFQGRQDGLIFRERWGDSSFSRGAYLFTDPKLGATVGWHTNQSALGGSSYFTCGAFTVTVDSNAAPIIAAGGTAVGNVIGAAVKTTVKP